jgi:hypothetical protein
VQALLAARIDRLPPEDKRLLQTGLNIEKLSYGATSAVACAFLVASPA